MAIIQTLARRRDLLQQTFITTVRWYAAPAQLSLGKRVTKSDITTGTKTVEVPVEKDVDKLINFVCGTKLLKDSGENIPIKPDSEYPDWLWTLHTGPPRPLSEYDPNSLEYWKRVRELGIEQEKELKKFYRQYRDYK